MVTEVQNDAAASSRYFHKLSIKTQACLCKLKKMKKKTYLSVRCREFHDKSMLFIVE